MFSTITTVVDKSLVLNNKSQMYIITFRNLIRCTQLQSVKNKIKKIIQREIRNNKYLYFDYYSEVSNQELIPICILLILLILTYIIKNIFFFT